VQSAEDARRGPAFKGLILWQKAQDLAKELVKLVDALPATRSASTIGNQLIRSGASVPANIAEGYGRYSEAAYRNHLSIARGSLFETVSWIDLLQHSGFVNNENAAALTEKCEEVNRLITAAMKPLRNARSIRDGGIEYDVDGNIESAL
jgi:four helix bundle protein